MIDFSRTFCDLHPNQLISNFCCKQECNIGLCATCICSHTESHIQKRTAPDYENIRTTYSKMQQNIRSRITSFEQSKSRINLIIETIHGKRKQVSQMILQARHQTLDFVNKFYDTKEKQLLRKIESDQKKLGLHNQNRMQSLLNLISRDVNTLFSSAQDLNSQTFLESFHRIRTQVLENSLQTYKQISVELQKNQNYQTNISINSLYINDVKNALQRSISILFGEKKIQKSLFDTPRQTNKSSRATLMNNQNSNITIIPKRPQSITKSSMIIPPRYNQPNEAYNQFLIKQTQAPVSKRPDIFIQNNSIQAQPSVPNINYGSRIELRPNSSQKMIKENVPIRQSIQHLSQNFMQASFGHIGGQYDTNKKIKKSGLTIFKQNESENRSVI